MKRARDASEGAADQSLARGSLEVVRDATLGGPDALGAPALRVYLPQGYGDPSNASARYPVLYLHDGQNVFDRGGSGVALTWGVDVALDKLIAQRSIDPWIVVAIDHRNEHRIGDYSPWPDPRLPIEARGARHAAFVAERVLPFVDATYRTRPDPASRAVGGSSLGGLMALYLGWTRRPLFSRVAALSPSVMWSHRQLFRFWSRKLANDGYPDPRIYLDVGSRELFVAGPVELEYGTDVREFRSHLEELGYTPDELRFVLDPAGGHDEGTWRRRIPAALRWLLAR